MEFLHNFLCDKESEQVVRDLLPTTIGESRRKNRAVIKTVLDEDGTSLVVDNNTIAIKRKNKITVQCTKRYDNEIAVLNTIGGVHVHERNGRLYLNGMIWDGKPFEI